MDAIVAGIAAKAGTVQPSYFIEGATAEETHISYYSVRIEIGRNGSDVTVRGLEMIIRDKIIIISWGKKELKHIRTSYTNQIDKMWDLGEKNPFVISYLFVYFSFCIRAHQRQTPTSTPPPPP